MCSACGVVAQVRGGWSKGMSWGQLARRMLPFLPGGSGSDRCALSFHRNLPIYLIVPAHAFCHESAGCKCSTTAQQVTPSCSGYFILISVGVQVAGRGG